MKRPIQVFFDKKNYYDPASPPASEDGEMDNIADFTDLFYCENLYSIDQMSIRGSNLLESKLLWTRKTGHVAKLKIA